MCTQKNHINEHPKLVKLMVKKMSQSMRFLSHRRAVKAQTSLPIYTDLPEPLLFAYTKYLHLLPFFSHSSFSCSVLIFIHNPFSGSRLMLNLSKKDHLKTLGEKE